MGRKKKFVNKTQYPDYAIERFTHCIFDDVLAFFATEEGQREYALWEEEQARIKASSCPSKSKRSAAFGESNASCEQEQAEYEAWEAEQAQLKKKKKAVTTYVVAASFLGSKSKRSAAFSVSNGHIANSQHGCSLCLLGLLLSWATGFGFGPYLPAVSEIGLLITGEINK